MTVNQNCKNEVQSLFQGPARNSIVEKQNRIRETNKKKKKWNKTKQIRKLEKAMTYISTKNQTHEKST